MYDVVIEWKLPQEPPRATIGAVDGEVVFIILETGGPPLRDWFTREEYERYLEEITPSTAVDAEGNQIET
jgi:hypothetical protein